MKKYLNLNTVYLVAAIIVLCAILIPAIIIFVNVRIQGISYLANNVEDYLNNAHPMKGEYTVKINLSNLEKNEGKVLFDDGENQIYVSKVIVNNEGDLELLFRSQGIYDLGGATLISGIEYSQSNNGFKSEFQAEAQANYEGDTYKLRPSGSTGLKYRNGDEFRFYLDIPNEINFDEETTIEVIVTKLYLNLWAKVHK